MYKLSLSILREYLWIKICVATSGHNWQSAYILSYMEKEQNILSIPFSILYYPVNIEIGLSPPLR